MSRLQRDLRIGPRRDRRVVSEEWPQLVIGDLVPKVGSLCGDEPQYRDLVVLRVVPSEYSPKVSIGTTGVIEKIKSGAQPVYLVDFVVTGGLSGRLERSNFYLVPHRDRTSASAALGLTCGFRPGEPPA